MHGRITRLHPHPRHLSSSQSIRISTLCPIITLPIRPSREFGGPPPSTTPGPPDSARIAVGSFVEQYTNRIQILGFHPRDSSSLTLLADASHPNPPTKLGFQPSTLFDSSSSERRDASLERERSSGERGYASPTTKMAKRGSWEPSCKRHFRRKELNYKITTQIGASCEHGRLPAYMGDLPERVFGSLSVQLRRRQRREEHRRPKALNFPSRCERRVSWLTQRTPRVHLLRSPLSPGTHPRPISIVTSSIDTTCTLWDLPTRTALTQLIAHDREVYDVDWCPGRLMSLPVSARMVVYVCSTCAAWSIPLSSLKQAQLPVRRNHDQEPACQRRLEPHHT